MATATRSHACPSTTGALLTLRSLCLTRRTAVSHAYTAYLAFPECRLRHRVACRSCALAVHAAAAAHTALDSTLPVGATHIANLRSSMFRRCTATGSHVTAEVLAV